MPPILNNDIDTVRPFQGRRESVLYPWVTTHGYSCHSPFGETEWKR